MATTITNKKQNKKIETKVIIAETVQHDFN